MATSTFKKGQDVWYKTKDGTYVEAKVASVDLSIRPVSYGIYLSGSDNFRETESPRLRSRDQGQHPTGQGSEQDISKPPDDQKEPVDQGQLQNQQQSEMSPRLTSVVDPQGVPEALEGSDVRGNDWSATRRRPHTVSAAFRPPALLHQDLKPGARQHTVKTAFRPPPEEEEDDFGDFSGADLPEPGSDTEQARARPVPLSAFGEEGDEDLEDLPEKVPRQVPRSSTFKTDNARPSPSPGHQHQAGLPQLHFHQTQPTPAESRRMPLHNLHPVIASTLFPARDIVRQASDDVPQKHLRQHATKGASPMSPAALSDDFGDFEEADMDMAEEANAQPVLPAEAATGAQHPLSTAISAVDKQKGTAIAPEGRQSAHVAAGSKTMLAGSSEKGDEDMEDEIPWYVDPETYKKPNNGVARVSEGGGSSSGFAGQAATAGKPASHLQPSILASQRLEPQPQQPLPLPEELVASGRPASSAKARQAKQGPAWLLPAKHNQMHEAGSGYYQATAEPKPSLPLPLLHDLDRVSTSPRAVPLHFPIQPEQHADLLAEAEQAPLPLPGRQVAHHVSQYGQSWDLQQQLRQQHALEQEALARQKEQSRLLQAVAAHEAAKTEGWQPTLRSYSDAWTQMVEVCAAELERGSVILQREAHLPPHQRRLTGTRGKDYLRALGQLYLSSLLLQSAMETHVQHHHRPPAFQDHLHRCSQAWSQGQEESTSLGEAIFRVAPQMPRHVERLPRQTSFALSEAPRWQQLRQSRERGWQDGLCGISLLPLDQLEELHVTTWMDKRPCLVLLANLWTNKVNSQAPQLQGWSV